MDSTPHCPGAGIPSRAPEQPARTGTAPGHGKGPRPWHWVRLRRNGAPDTPAASVVYRGLDDGPRVRRAPVAVATRTDTTTTQREQYEVTGWLRALACLCRPSGRQPFTGFTAGRRAVRTPLRGGSVGPSTAGPPVRPPTAAPLPRRAPPYRRPASHRAYVTAGTNPHGNSDRTRRAPLVVAALVPFPIRWEVTDEDPLRTPLPDHDRHSRNGASPSRAHLGMARAPAGRRARPRCA